MLDSALPDCPPCTWALLGPGRIARRFAEAVQALPGQHLAAVWGRSPERAQHFAQAWPSRTQGGARAVTRLEALLADPQVDAVYIATPHDSHAALARACIEAGKAVLCEKPLTPTAAQTQALSALAQAHQVLLIEALWMAFLPLHAQVRLWLQQGLIGELQRIESAFCFEVPYQPESRLFSPQHAGGSLLDIGIYNLAITRLAMSAAFGSCPEPAEIEAQGWLAPSGVDQRVQGLLRFANGTTSHFVCAFDRADRNACTLYGSAGEICLEQDFWQATRAVLRRDGQAPVFTDRPWAVNGFEYQIAETARCLRTGHLQSAAMPHSESLALARWLDLLRQRVGVRYPFE